MHESSPLVEGTTSFRVYKRRWWFLFVYFMLNFCNAVRFATFGSINTVMYEYFPQQSDVHKIGNSSRVQPKRCGGECHECWEYLSVYLLSVTSHQLRQEVWIETKHDCVWDGDDIRRCGANCCSSCL